MVDYTSRMEKIFSPHLTLAKRYWKEHLKQSDLAIDATCGNGHDTLFLAEICEVVGIDIQNEAIASTEALLLQHEKRAILQRLCHSEIDTLPLPYSPHLIVYNLGYLPRGDKSLTTKTDTTLPSVKKSLELLGPGGALSITCYPGHEEGAVEETALLEWAATLPNTWSVCYHKWPNRHRSPTLLWIQRIWK